MDDRNAIEISIKLLVLFLVSDKFGSLQMGNQRPPAMVRNSSGPTDVKILWIRIVDYNAHHPHSSLGNLTPSEYAKLRQGKRTSEAAESQSRTAY